MNLRNIPLSSLVLFDALMAEQSVSRAAERVATSPSAMSHALRRLRRTFNDELIRRTPRGMEPTQRARDFWPFLRQGLQQIQRGLEQQLRFDPKRSERTFRLAISDYLVACILPRVCVRLREEAPGVTLVVEYLSTQDRHAAQEPGEIQLRVCASSWGRAYRQERVLSDRFLVVMRRGHPAAAEEMTPERLLSLPFLKVSNAMIGSQAIDEELEKRGVSRWVPLIIPNLSAVIPIVANSDLCAFLPGQWVKMHDDRDSLAKMSIPTPEIEYTVDVIWQKDDDRDAGHRWLRELIIDEFRVLFSPNGGRLPA